MRPVKRNFFVVYFKKFIKDLRKFAMVAKSLEIRSRNLGNLTVSFEKFYTIFKVLEFWSRNLGILTVSFGKFYNVFKVLENEIKRFKIV